MGIGNLRVVLANHGDHWTAQGLEIDYCAVGTSLAEAQKRFEMGLSATISVNLKEYGTIEHMLRIAPVDVWQQFLRDAANQLFKHSQLSEHKLPKQVRAIEYYERQKAA